MNARRLPMNVGGFILYRWRFDGRASKGIPGGVQNGRSNLFFSAFSRIWSKFGVKSYVSHGSNWETGRFKNQLATDPNMSSTTAFFTQQLTARSANIDSRTLRIINPVASDSVLKPKYFPLTFEVTAIPAIFDRHQCAHLIVSHSLKFCMRDGECVRTFIPPLACVRVCTVCFFFNSFISFLWRMMW